MNADETDRKEFRSCAAEGASKIAEIAVIARHGEDRKNNENRHDCAQFIAIQG